MEIQITAIKFETINGKKTGKSFAFKLDPKKMAVFKTEATLRKKIEEYVAKSGVFKKDELKDLKYNMKDFLGNGEGNYRLWRQKNLQNLTLHPTTRKTVSRLITSPVSEQMRSLSLDLTSKGSIMEEQLKPLWRISVPSWDRVMAYRERAMPSPQ